MLNVWITSTEDISIEQRQQGSDEFSRWVVFRLLRQNGHVGFVSLASKQLHALIVEVEACVKHFSITKTYHVYSCS